MLICIRRPLALGVGKKALADTSSRPDFTHDGSDYSEGRRERALGLEEMKFLRAVGEGETPMTTAAEHEGITPSTLVNESDPIGPAQLSSDAAPQSPPPATSSTLSGSSGRALKSLMDQRGPFELPGQPKTKHKHEDSVTLSLTPATPPPALPAGDPPEVDQGGEEPTTSPPELAQGLQPEVVTVPKENDQAPPPPLSGLSKSAPSQLNIQAPSVSDLEVPQQPTLSAFGFLLWTMTE